MQSASRESPDLLEYLPKLHSSHDCSLLPAVAVEYLPAPHSLHEVAPALVPVFVIEPAAQSAHAVTRVLLCGKEARKRKHRREREAKAKRSMADWRKSRTAQEERKLWARHSTLMENVVGRYYHVDWRQQTKMIVLDLIFYSPCACICLYLRKRRFRPQYFCVLRIYSLFWHLNSVKSKRSYSSQISFPFGSGCHEYSHVNFTAL